MKTEDLIALLAKDESAPAKPHAKRRMALAAVLGLALGLALLVSFLRIRPDIGAATGPVLLKALFSAAFAGAAAPLLLRMGQPGRPWRNFARALIGLGGLAAAAGLVAFIGAAPEKRYEALMGTGAPWCVVFIPLLALPSAVLLTFVLRALAPTRLAATGAALGAFSGGLGAVVYSMYCPVDHVAFVTVWYAAAIGLCAALGAIAGARLLRW